MKNNYLRNWKWWCGHTTATVDGGGTGQVFEIVWTRNVPVNWSAILILNGEGMMNRHVFGAKTND